MKLHPVNHTGDKNRFCGPAVISAVTGMKTGEAARLLRSVTGRSCIMGVEAYELEWAFTNCGVDMLYLPPVEGNPTLADWLRQTYADRTAGRVFLINAGHHWQLVSCNRYVCGLTRDIVDVKDPRVKRRVRVKAVYELTAAGPITTPHFARKR